MELTQEQKDALLSGLYELAKDGPTDASFGICWNLDQLAPGQNAYGLVSHHSVDWPGLTGDVTTYRTGRRACTHPIRREYDAYENRIPLWEGSQLDQRVLLIEYLIAELGA